MKLLENVPISFSSSYAICWYFGAPFDLSVTVSAIVATAASTAWWLGGFTAQLLRQRSGSMSPSQLDDAFMMSGGYCPVCFHKGVLKDITPPEVTSMLIMCADCGQHYDITPVDNKPHVVRRGGMKVVRTDDV